MMMNASEVVAQVSQAYCLHRTISSCPGVIERRLLAGSYSERNMEGRPTVFSVFIGNEYGSLNTPRLVKSAERNDLSFPSSRISKCSAQASGHYRVR